MSDFIPNSYQTPNAYVDSLMAFLTPEEWKVLSYMARRIFGFNKREDRISLSQMEHGIVDGSGNRLDHGTGLGRTALIKALAGLKRYHIALEVAPNDPKCNKGACYALNLDSGKVDWQGLEARHQEAKAKSQQRTGKAREVKADRLTLADCERIADSCDSPVCGTDQLERGLSDILPPVCGTDPARSVGQTHNNQLEIQKKNSMCANDAQQKFAQVVQSPTKRPTSPKPRKRQPSQQAVLFESQPSGGGPSQEAPKQSRKRDALWDAIQAAWKTGEADAMTGLIRQQLTGKIPLSNPKRDSNFDVPATPDEVQAFAEWYSVRYPRCDMPTSPPKIQLHFYAFRREQAGKQQTGADGFVFIPGLGYQQIAV